LIQQTSPQFDALMRE